MTHWRAWTVGLLVAVPFVFLALTGAYAIWARGWAFYVWWPLMGCMTAGYLLGWYWMRQRRLLPPVDTTVPLYWTERDKQAWPLVQANADKLTQLDLDQLTEIEPYIDLAQDMARELAEFYHPGAADPFGPLTIPEVLTVIELASHDLAEIVEKNLPGGHLFTIAQWRRAKQVTDWYRTATNVYWLASAVFMPVETALRFTATKFGVGKSLDLLQHNLVAWLAMHYVHRLGTYLIELNSGRLRVGAEAYRKWQQQGGPPPAEAPTGESARQVTLTIMGQVKMGKSSFINALLGEQRARTDVLPATATVTRYELQPENSATKLVLLDTVGYAHTGPKADQLRATREAAQGSDLLILVLHARNPARLADLEMLTQLRSWFTERPNLKMPPILAVVTHIDLLTPAMEWAPPYDLANGQRPKEQHMREARASVQEQLGTFLVGAVPLCTQPGKVYGIQEWLLPVLTELLDEAHAVGMVRCLWAEADAGKVRRLLDQVLALGKNVVQSLLFTRARQEEESRKPS